MTKTTEFLTPPTTILIEDIKTDLVALIDADDLKYNVTYRISEEVARPYNFTNRKDMEEIIEKYISLKTYGLELSKPAIFLFSGKSKDIFRNNNARDKAYKGNRKNREELYVNERFDQMNIVKYVKDNYPSLQYPCLEADDLLALLQDEGTFIISGDKDLLQVEGYHYIDNKLKYISPADGWRFLMKQMLIGDPVDNVSGVFGLGKESPLLEGFDACPINELHEYVLKIYIDKYKVRKGIDRFNEMYTLLSLLLNRGKYNREKYNDAFVLLESIKSLK